MIKQTKLSNFFFAAAAVMAAAAVLALPPQFVAAQQPTKRPPQRSAHPAPAQAAGTQQNAYKGIWEPVNYGQDLLLTDVFFVSPEVGYVSGAGGTILKTSDGGRSWKILLGGDPQSQEPRIYKLAFLDPTHGWALQGGSNGDPAKLLRTSDGENWEQTGMTPPYYSIVDYAFISPMTGILLASGSTSIIYRTVDGGRTWKEVLPDKACHFTAEVQGLSKDERCSLIGLSMVSRLVGYAIGAGNYEAPDAMVVAKTTDGGITWGLVPTKGPGPLFGYPAGQNYMGFSFQDENQGFLTTSNGFCSTSDGGQSWHGLVGKGPGPIKFADPEIGWSFLSGQLSYTTDGGKRWNSRQFYFPVAVSSYSLPRRDRAYAVGEHGMIYRYRVVPANYTVAHAIDAPAMPGVDSPVPREVATLRDTLAKLQTKLLVPAAGAATAGGAYVDSCCGPLAQQLETSANAFATDVPAFSQRFRNLNLILQGLQFLNQVTSQAETLKQSIRALRQAPNQQAASVAFTQVSSQVDGISASGGFVQDTTLPAQP